MCNYRCLPTCTYATIQANNQANIFFLIIIIKQILSRNSWLLLIIKSCPVHTLSHRKPGKQDHVLDDDITKKKKAIMLTHWRMAFKEAHYLTWKLSTPKWFCTFELERLTLANKFSMAALVDLSLFSTYFWSASQMITLEKK